MDKSPQPGFPFHNLEASPDFTRHYYDFRRENWESWAFEKCLVTLFKIGVQCPYNIVQFLLYNEVNQLYVYIYPLSRTSLSPISPFQVTPKHRAELPVLYSRFPLAVCLTHWQGIYVNPNLPIHHSSPSPPSVHMSIL